MNLDVKAANGYVLIKKVDIEVDACGLNPDFFTGEVVVGPEPDLGVIVFVEHDKLKPFNDCLFLVAIADIRVIANVKKEEPVSE